VQSVETYEDGSWQAASEESYRLRGQRLEVDSLGSGETVRVKYDAGYQRLPQGLKLQMLQDVRVAYDHRDMYEGADLSDSGVLTRSAYEQWSVQR